jgi:hypothetical protein
MAKTKDRLMLEKIFNTVKENASFDDYCEVGQETLKELAKHLNKDISELGADLTRVFLEVSTDDFEIPDMYNRDCPDEENFEVEVSVKYKGKVIKTTVSNYNVCLY